MADETRVLDEMSVEELRKHLADSDEALAANARNRERLQESNRLVRRVLADKLPGSDTSHVLGRLPGKVVKVGDLRPLGLGQEEPFPAMLLVEFEDGSALSVMTQGPVEVFDGELRETRRLTNVADLPRVP